MKNLFPIFLLLSFILKSFVSIAKSEEKHIFFINSYFNYFPTYQLVEKAINEFSNSNCIIDIEFLNSKELYTPTYKKINYHLLKYKIEQRNPYDAIVTIDNNALDFTLTYPEFTHLALQMLLIGYTSNL